MVRAAKSKISKKEKSDHLYQAILMLENEEECYHFFQDLCTISELRSMEQRFEVAMLLNDGHDLQRHSRENRRVQRHDQPREPLPAQRRRAAMRAFSTRFRRSARSRAMSSYERAGRVV